jgi:Flp pilus assembly protein TadD
MMEHPETVGPSRRTQYFLLACLALVTLAAYARALTCGFVYYDDGLYVFDNVYVRTGFTLAGLRHIFITGETGTWQPLALLSHTIDCQLFGLSAWGHHLSAIVLHAANAVLLAIALTRLTGRFYPGLAVAAIFALHPAHVESVAWISERKDVLSTLFWMLCFLAYERYARGGGRARYVLLCALLTLGLMAKPMLVTLPCVLVLLDYWPLARFDRNKVRIFLEKAPLFAIVAASCVVTLIVQRQNQAIVSLENLPLAARLENVAVSYVKYIAIMFWPAGLAIDYPHPKDTLPLPQVLASCALLAAVTVAVVATRRRAPYALAGWLWYLGTLVPVIGFVHVGEQGMADRYTYVPSIGLTIAVVWTIEAWLSRAPRIAAAHGVRIAIILPLLAICSVLTWKQIGNWKTTESLWARAVAVNPMNERAQRNLGSLYVERKEYARAVPHLDAALKLFPGDPRTLRNLAYAHQQLGNIEMALDLFMRATRIEPDNIDTRNNAGLCLMALNRDAEAVSILQDAARLRPGDADVASNLGIALCKTNRVDEAIAVLKDSARQHPAIATLHNNLGIALNMKGARDEALAEFREALRIDPSHDDAKRNLKALGG